MKTLHFISCSLFILLIMATGCRASDEQLAPNTDDGKIFITDRTGRKWDITHAVEKYDMDPKFFNFGIGLGAIPSVDEPVVVGSDDSDYPTRDFSVFGVNHNDEQRAYSITELTRHEVFNEEYPGESQQHVAVAY